MEIGIIFALMMGIACPVIMGLMMWLMFRDMRPHHSSDSSGSAAERLAALRKQQYQIEAEMAELSRMIEQEAQPISATSTYVREEHETATS